MKSIRALCLVCVLASVSPSFSAVIVTDSCSSLDTWDILDLDGDGFARIVTDYSTPPGYGPTVIHVRGTRLLGMVKGFDGGDGVYTVLYRENRPVELDADGVTLFRAQFGSDIRVAHNTKDVGPHLWLEQDNDGGFQVRIYAEGANDTLLTIAPGVGLVTDPWNRTRWIWQKVRIDGDRLRAKYWPAHVPEPNSWDIDFRNEILSAEFRTGRAGFKIVSGDANIAWFSFSDEEIAVPAPEAWLAYERSRATQVRSIGLSLFTNIDRAMTPPLRVVVWSAGAIMGSAHVGDGIPSGQRETSVSVGTHPESADIEVALPRPPEPGPIDVEIVNSAGEIIASRTIMYQPEEELVRRLTRVESALTVLEGVAARAGADDEASRVLSVVVGATRSHADRATGLLRAGEVQEATRSAAFAEYSLAELNGWKGELLRELAPNARVDVDSPPPPTDPDLADGERPQIVYPVAYRIRFEEPRLNARSLVMGQRYNVVIPWTVDGATPDRDWRISVRLVDPIRGTTAAQLDTVPAVSTSRWEPGRTYVTACSLAVLPERQGVPADVRSGNPLVRDVEHVLVVRMYDPETGSSLLLGNAPDEITGAVGQDFDGGRYHVSSIPLEVAGPDLPPSGVGVARSDSFAVRNVGLVDEPVNVLCSIYSETDRVLHRVAWSAVVQAGGERAFGVAWTPATAGNIRYEVELLRAGSTLTRVVRSVDVDPPPGYDLQLVRGHTRASGGGASFATPLTVRSGVEGRVSVEVLARSAIPGEAARVVGDETAHGDEATVYADPFVGWYDVRSDFRDFRWDRRIIATDVATADGDLLVNGEPFIVKGVNTHGMESSPARARAMIDVMKRLGFNSWRGDHPRPWLTDLAAEMNTFWSVLAPFSCASTSEYFAAYGGPPLVAEREISRLFVEQYVRSPGVLLWNSANEIGEATTDFLLATHPLYRAYDPAGRPVHYANLFGQNRWQGQDVMGINYYFGGETARDRQPVVRQSIELARKNGLPVIYTEFNGYRGPVPSDAVESLRDQFEWGLEAGMSGGFFYYRFNSRSHPGVYDGSLNTNPRSDAAFIAAFADAEVTLARSHGRAVELAVSNRRRFWLRDVRLSLDVDGTPLDEIVVDDLSPGERREVSVLIRPNGNGPAHVISGAIEFVTHHGVYCHVPIRVVVP